MKRSAQLELAEDIALVTFAMMEALAVHPEQVLPGRYRYHAFDGFPGFCDHAGAAGLALHTIWRLYDRDQWLDIAVGYAEDVVAYAIEHERPASVTVLASLALASRQSAVRERLARRGRPS